MQLTLMLRDLSTIPLVKMQNTFCTILLLTKVCWNALSLLANSI